MTTTLSERLRWRHKAQWRADGSVTSAPDVLCQEAADELDRLREECARAADRIEADSRDAKRYRAFRELVKSNPVRAQALVWEAKPSRTRFDALVDDDQTDHFVNV